MKNLISGCLFVIALGSPSARSGELVDFASPYFEMIVELHRRSRHSIDEGAGCESAQNPDNADDHLIMGCVSPDRQTLRFTTVFELYGQKDRYLGSCPLESKRVNRVTARLMFSL